MKEIAEDLNQQLLNQQFEKEENQEEILSRYQHIAQGYTIIENSIAVLSDLQSNSSYIYLGELAVLFDIHAIFVEQKIDSIWEECILQKIHKEDLIKKHTLELQFFHFLKSVPIHERKNYHATCIIRMQDKFGNYTSVKHRLFYVTNSCTGSFWLALCLYNIHPNIEQGSLDQSIINSLTGQSYYPRLQDYISLLTKREKEILMLVDEGKLSKEIANILSISLYTIHRHRQNILEKLQVKNSHEACQLAKLMQLI